MPGELTQANPYDVSLAPAAASGSQRHRAGSDRADGRRHGGDEPEPWSGALLSINSSQQLLSANHADGAADGGEPGGDQGSEFPGIAVLQERLSTATSHRSGAPSSQRQVIYGFSAYNARTGEAYLVELVPADQDVFDQLPDPTENLTYDPFYVRVVFLKHAHVLQHVDHRARRWCTTSTAISRGRARSTRTCLSKTNELNARATCTRCPAHRAVSTADLPAVCVPERGRRAVGGVHERPVLLPDRHAYGRSRRSPRPCSLLGP